MFVHSFIGFKINLFKQRINSRFIIQIKINVMGIINSPFNWLNIVLNYIDSPQKIFILPGYCLDFIHLSFIIWKRQLASLVIVNTKKKDSFFTILKRWALIQVETYRILWDIEINHLMEKAFLKRTQSFIQNTENFIPLPHVDTISNNLFLSNSLFNLKQLCLGTIFVISVSHLLVLTLNKTKGPQLSQQLSFLAPRKFSIISLCALGSSFVSSFYFISHLFGKNQIKNKNSHLDDSPIITDLVLIGGGHSHLYVLKSFKMRPEPGLRITLISTSLKAPYSSMLPGYICGKYSFNECHIDLLRLCQFAKIRFVQGHVIKLDVKKKLVYFVDKSPDTLRPPISYDILSINIGGVSTLPSLDNSNDQFVVTPIKPISELCEKWDSILNYVIENISKKFLTIGVVGGGPGGVEVMFAIHERLSQIVQFKEKIRLIIITNKNSFCSNHNEIVQTKIEHMLKERNIEIYKNFHVTNISGGKINSHDGRSLFFNKCLWCTGVRPQAWIKQSGLATDSDGFISVKSTLQSENIKNIFGAGDCVNIISENLPKAGVFAVREGPPLEHNLRLALYNELLLDKSKAVPYLPYVPQKSFLGIITAGNTEFIASRGEMALEGKWLGELKEWIDRKWINSYTSQLPLMQSEPEDSKGNIYSLLKKESHMRCGGCAAKVGKDVLDGVLGKLTIPTRVEVKLGLDNPDDCSIVQFDPKNSDNMVAQTVDFFRSFISDPFLFGRIAANHALSDCYAMCAHPVSAMVIAVLPFGSQKIVERELLQIMAGVCEMLSSSKCALSGGHTCEGKELALGLSVSASVQGSILHKTGACVGDVIILTKPIGTGVIFAAHMRVLAKCEWVDQAVDSMLASNEVPALLARSSGAHSCTDVTGFGLLGHLYETMNGGNFNLSADLYLG